MNLAEIQRSVENFGPPAGAPPLVWTADGPERIGFNGWICSLPPSRMPDMKRRAEERARVFKAAAALRCCPQDVPIGTREEDWQALANAGARAIAAIETARDPHDLHQIARAINRGAEAHAVLVSWGW